MSPPDHFDTRHRHLAIVRGSATQTRAIACERLAGTPAEGVLWVSEHDPEHGFETLPPPKIRLALGRSFDVVVLDAHAGLDADALGAGHGLVSGGGTLAIRLSATAPGCSDSRSDGPDHASRLAAFPYEPSDVGTRFVHRALARLGAATDGPQTRWPRPVGATRGHEEQRQVVEALDRHWRRPTPTRVVLLADRGRGKSSALGLALRQHVDTEGTRVVITAAHPDAVREVVRFAGAVAFVPLADLALSDRHRPTLIVVDEAAQLPVPLLRRLVQAHPGAHLAFATTTHGYEGTGRGFSLRFCPWLDAQPVPVTSLTITRPIRWDPGDPVERAVFDALLLDAEPAELDARVSASPLRFECIDRDQLVADEASLRALFGLLVHAHYRTTPGDLHRILDAPNLDVHVAREGEQIVAATVVAHEGGLPDALLEQMVRGHTRIRAHALPDALVAHLGHRDLGALTMKRSVRIATHPDRRRRGIARGLVDHVHRHYAPDLFGTIFGATPAVLRFRQRLGYQLVRVSASRGARTGEPSVMMLRPVSARARAAVELLRVELARELPRQLELLQADGETLLDPRLVHALTEALPTATPIDHTEAMRLARSYAFGPRTMESVAVALRTAVSGLADRMAELEPMHRALIETRIVEGRGWLATTEASGAPSVPAAMRALRRAVRALLATDRAAAADPG